MSMSDAAQLADLITALAVICSLLFVAFEFRRSNTLRRYQNAHMVGHGLKEFRSQSLDPALASIIAKGREDYTGLSDSNKIVFGAYMEVCVQTFVPFLLYRAANIVEEGLDIGMAHLRFQFGFPGVHTCWNEYHKTRRFPKVVTAKIQGMIPETVNTVA